MSEDNTARLDYERLADEADQQEPIPLVPPGLEPQTKGPVLIDTVHGVVRDAQTGEELLRTHYDEPKREAELDLTWVALGLSVLCGAVFIAAAALSPFTASQKCALCAVVVGVMAERLWWEIRRVPAPTEPEGVAYVTDPNAGNGYDNIARAIAQQQS